MEIIQGKTLHGEHPNPQMARAHFLLLDGLWQCNGRSIRVPYAPEAEQSGYEDRRAVLDAEGDGRLVYETEFILPKDFALPRVILHFGAVDQVCDVYVNDCHVGHHEGGYLSFSFDITEALGRDSKDQKESKAGEAANVAGGEFPSRHFLRVEVTDTLSHFYPYGKQRRDRGGMWYTPVSGIWKSVWLENVPGQYVVQWKITPDLTGADVKAVMNTGQIYQKRWEPEAPRLWSPDEPYLYPLSVSVEGDTFETYAALREISIQSIGGVNRVCLNKTPVFLHGVLDQGYWPKGLYTAGEPADYDKDILAMKELGFCLLRKHCKVEPAYFYFACDRLGMLVCQDMVNSGGYHYVRDTVLPTLGFKRRRDSRKLHAGGERAEPRSSWKDAYDEAGRRKFFLAHCRDTLQELYNHPSVIMYTIFNEGWGQFDSDLIYDALKAEDGTRLFDSTSGWFAQTRSDFDTEHIYFRNKRLHPGKRPMFLKECGGYSLPVAGHLWNEKETYGYGACKNKKELTNRIRRMYEEMVYPSVKEGLCGCVYTQLCDIEDEINGLYTYDRSVCKVEKEEMRKIRKEIDERLTKTS